jgi:pantetheine-phosphate adenylyltransferase
MTVAIYPGRFDPATLGHLDIAIRASKIFDELIVAVYEGGSSTQLFDTKSRMQLLKTAVTPVKNIQVQSFRGLVVNYARHSGAQVIIRGLRGGGDFEYEYEMAFMNQNLAPDIELVCFMTSLKYQFIRSSLIKEVAGLGGDISNLVPPHVAKAINRKLGHG